MIHNYTSTDYKSERLSNRVKRKKRRLAICEHKLEHDELEAVNGIEKET
jgi:hypothetical protein